MNPFESIPGIDQYFSDFVIECPYGLGHPAVYHQAAFSSLPPALFGRFLEAGYRRNGNTLYAMRCIGCNACVPIRLDLRAFRSGTGMKRVLARNRDLEVEIAPLAVSGEKLALLDRFLLARYPGKGSTALDYYRGFFANSLGLSMEISFRLAGRLVGVSVVDCPEGCLSAVYFYFDPDFGKRSLGTFNILFLAELALLRGLKHLYLGYWIADLPAMAYKARFRPHELLRCGRWQQVAETKQ